MLSLIDSCQNKLYADQYHVTISRTQVSQAHASLRFSEVDRGPGTGFTIGSRAQARLLLWGRRREYVQRQNYGAN